MEKVWLKNYPSGIETEINPEQYTSLTAMFFEACDRFARLPGFYNNGKTLTFAELAEKSRDFAAFLQNIGLRKGDQLVIMLPNILQYPIALFAALRIGLIVVNLNPLYTVRELVQQLSIVQPQAILTLTNLVNKIEEVQATLPLPNIIITNLGDSLDFLKRILINTTIKLKNIKSKSKTKPKYYTFLDALKIGNKLTLRTVNISNKDIAFLQYTGGTTGIPKAAMLTHGNILANIAQGDAWLKYTIKPGKEIIITALPLYHIFSLTANCFIFLHNGGLNVLITNPRNIKSCIKELSKFKFTAITGVNTFFNALLNCKLFRKLDFRALKISLSGGMALQASTSNRWQEITKTPLLESYGLTEASPGVCMAPLQDKPHNGYIGLPLPSTEISIRDINGQELAFDQPGELWVRGPQVMRGYWQQTVETKQVLTKDGWLKTGDIALINHAGYVKIIDRKKNIIIVSGFNVYPAEIEAVIAKINGVKEVLVFGIEHKINGEIIKALVVRDKLELTEQNILQECSKYLARYKIPRIIEFRTEIIKSSLGKVMRANLITETELEI